MVITDMHIGFKLKMEGYETLTYRDWHNDEIDYWLNEAIRVFTIERWNGYKGKSFEEGQKRIEDLRSILKDYSGTPITNFSIDPSPLGDLLQKPNAYYFSLPDDYWLADEEEVTLNVADVAVRTGITECVGDSYSFMIENPFSSHKLRFGKAKPLRIFGGSIVEVVTDGNYTVTAYHLRYIRKPAVVLYPSVSCDLNPLVHEEIVEKAVSMAVARVGDPNKYQLSVTEELKNLN